MNLIVVSRVRGATSCDGQVEEYAVPGAGRARHEDHVKSCCVRNHHFTCICVTKKLVERRERELGWRMEDLVLEGGI